MVPGLPTLSTSPNECLQRANQHDAGQQLWNDSQSYRQRQLPIDRSQRWSEAHLRRLAILPTSNARPPLALRQHQRHCYQASRQEPGWNEIQTFHAGTFVSDLIRTLFVCLFRFWFRFRFRFWVWLFFRFINCRYWSLQRIETIMLWTDRSRKPGFLWRCVSTGIGKLNAWERCDQFLLISFLLSFISARSPTR
jgi:hypothetical protein